MLGSYARAIAAHGVSYTLLVCVVLALPFSYYPLIHAGSIAGINIDISLLYVLLLAAIACSLSYVVTNRRLLTSNTPWILLVGLTMYTSVSVLWSANSARGIITAGFMWALLLLVSSIIVHYPTLVRQKKIIITLLTGSVLVSLGWALWQLLGDAIGVSSAYTLLPSTYDGSVFGIARPTGFALEPQFFANILLAPFGWLIWRYLRRDTTIQTPLAIIVVATFIVLSLSRGALVASIIIIGILLVTSHGVVALRAKLVGILVLSIVTAAIATYSIATVRQTDTTTGYEALSGAVAHLSLGTISLPQGEDSTPDNTPSAVSASTAANPAPAYVRSSTTSRLSMSSEALRIWQRNPATTLFGVGTGGFGASLSNPANGAVVNNYYLEMLVELGIVGILLFVGLLSTLGTRLYRAKSWLLLSLLAGYAVQLSFFSGNANIVHVWVLIGIVVASVVHVQHKQHYSAK